MLAASWDFARSLNIESLKEVCINKMREQFQRFVQTDLFVRQPADIVLNLLRRNDLPVDSEEDVFAAISRWVCPCEEIDQQRLELHAPALLKEVRWCRTSVTFRKHLVDSHPIFQTLNQCGDKPPCPFNPWPRSPKLIFIFGKDKDQARGSVLCFDSDLHKGERIADMGMLEGASYSVIGESIFVVGGCNLQRNYIASVKEFLVNERRWRNRAPLKFGRSAHAAAVVKAGGEKSLLGVFGGHHAKDFISCELYDVSGDRWLRLPGLWERRSSSVAACLPGDSRVFVFGGRCKYSWLASVEFCELGADWEEKLISARTESFWQLAAPMQIARSQLAATTCRGNIIVAGGNGAAGRLKAVELFTPPDPSNPLGQWTVLANMNQPRADFTLLTSVNAVFALGSETEPYNTVEAFSPPAGSPDSGDDFSTWMWSPGSPVETFDRIWGAVGTRM